MLIFKQGGFMSNQSMRRRGTQYELEEKPVGFEDKAHVVARFLAVKDEFDLRISSLILAKPRSTRAILSNSPKGIPILNKNATFVDESSRSMVELSKVVFPVPGSPTKIINPRLSRIPG